MTPWRAILSPHPSTILKSPQIDTSFKHNTDEQQGKYRWMMAFPVYAPDQVPGLLLTNPKQWKFSSHLLPGQMKTSPPSRGLVNMHTNPELTDKCQEQNGSDSFLLVLSQMPSVTPRYLLGETGQNVLVIGRVLGTGEGNGNLLQYSCLENPMDREAWRATFHGVAKSQT